MPPTTWTHPPNESLVVTSSRLVPAISLAGGVVASSLVASAVEFVGAVAFTPALVTFPVGCVPVMFAMGWVIVAEASRLSTSAALVSSATKIVASALPSNALMPMFSDGMR
jgi:hypothetical protein